jgi:hypothetical protein
MGRAFLVASVAGLALCLAFPGLLPFAIAGIAVGLAPPAVSFLRERRSWIAVIGGAGGVLALLGLGAALLSLLHFAGAPEPRTAIAIPVTYLGTGTYEDDPERLALLDRVSVSFDDLRAAAADYRLLREIDAPERARARLRGEDPPPSIGPGELERLLVRHLSRSGWRLAERSTEGDTLVKRREVALRSRVLPTETANEVPLPRLPAEAAGGEVLFDFELAERSQMVLVAPPRTISSTRPAGEGEERPASGLEERRVPVAGAVAVEVDVRSPWFRSAVLSALAGWTLSWGKYLLGVLLGIVIAVLSEPVKEWLRQRLGIGKGSAESA